jgi:S-adenosylmethionine synthetase
VGKIYNVLAHRVAKKLYENIDGAREVYVLMLSRIGTPINEPQVATAQVMLEGRRRISDIAKKAEGIVARELASINKFCMELSKGKYPIC